jgi:hypothetical protein
VLSRLSVTSLTLAAALLSGPVPAQNRTLELRARFTKEVDPVHKAHMLPQLADSEFRDMQTLIAASNLTEASEVANHLSEEAELAVKALDAKPHDPEKHPDGYKQAEMSVRSSLRRIDDILVGLAADDQQPFLAVRNRLGILEHQLIRELFPHRPDADPGPILPGT